MKNVKLSDLANKFDVRTIIAAKLGCSAESIPVETASELAKSLQCAPAVQVVNYTTKSGKQGVYLETNDAVPAGRFGGGGRLFHRLGDPDEMVTEKIISKLRSAADVINDASVGIHELCDELES